MKFLNTFRTNGGFSLVELVITIALIAILSLVAAPPIRQAYKSYDISASRNQALLQARSALNRMVREMRLIQSSSDVLTVSSSSSFTFEYPDGTSLVYSKSGSNLLRNSDVILENVSALTFTYYNSAGATTSTAANVRRVKISITVATTHSHGNLTLGTDVFIRNAGTKYSGFGIN